MKKHLEKNKEEEKRISRYMQDRERLRQKKEAIKQARDQKKRKDYRMFLDGQVKAHQLLLIEKERQEKCQATIFGELTETFRNEQENGFLNKIKGQKLYKQELENQIKGKKEKADRKLKENRQGEDQAELLAKIISNDKQISMLKHGLL